MSRSRNWTWALALASATLLRAGSVALADVVYVDADASGANHGTSWEDAYTELRDALANLGEPEMQIWVAEGTYTPAPSAGSRFGTCG